jgi:glutathione S-transferase
MKLYIANKNYSSWSLRPWVLMTTLGLPFNVLAFGQLEKDNRLYV